MKGFNLSEWALRHRSLVAYFMLMIVIAGVGNYFKLGRSEDPDFTVKTMVVAAEWPGATVHDTLEQITDRLERKLQETPSLDYVKNRPDRARESPGTRSVGSRHRGHDAPLPPILLTAAAAILGMIPIAPTIFWGPMAYAIMGGLAIATLLTLVFLPALYVAWFGIRMPRSITG